MKRDVARHQDHLIRSLPRVDDSAVARSLDPALRDALLEAVVVEPLPARSWGRSHRRLAVALGVVGILVISTAGAYAGREAWQRLHPDQAVEMSCVQSQDANHEPTAESFVIPTGDPLADCAADWQRQFGEPAPELAAYSGPRGEIRVQPKAWPTPDGWETLPAGFTLDAGLLELDHSLQDSVRGLESGCFSEDEGRAEVEATLARLGLQGWKVHQRDDPDGVDTCARFVWAEPEAKVVTLMAQETHPAPDLPFQTMAAQLRTTPECLDHDQALAAVRKAGQAAGIPEGIEGYQLVEPPTTSGATAGGATDPGCVRIVMLVFGGITVELWR